MQGSSICTALLLNCLLCAPGAAAAFSCTKSDPRYRLSADTVNWAMQLASGQNCEHGPGFNDVMIPSSGQVTVHGSSFTYAARAGFQGNDSFTRDGTGSKWRVNGNSTIRLNVIMTAVQVAAGFIASQRSNGGASTVEGLATAARVEPLPEGNSGIAARYPGDAGITSDPNVIFADDFESYSSVADLTSKWSRAYHYENIRIATEPGNVFAGSKALEFTVPQRNTPWGQSVVKVVDPERDVLFLRYYTKIDPEYSAVGSTHVGSTISSRYCCPGVRADGYNKFLISLEPGRYETVTPSPGSQHIYIYHPEQRDIWGDHFFPTGRVVPNDVLLGNFGPDFVARPEIIPPLGRWYCNELMVKVNTPDKRDGRVAAWLDGKLVADFGNLRLRDTYDLKIDRFTLDFFIYKNTSGLAKIWLDNVVAASTYIGPRMVSVP